MLGLVTRPVLFWLRVPRHRMFSRQLQIMMHKRDEYQIQLTAVTISSVSGTNTHIENAPASLFLMGAEGVLDTPSSRHRQPQPLGDIECARDIVFPLTMNRVAGTIARWPVTDVQPEFPKTSTQPGLNPRAALGLVQLELGWCTTALCS